MMQLYNQNCIEVLKGIEDKSIDLVVTDCPYHIVSGGCTKDPVKIGRYKDGGGIFEKRKDKYGNLYYSEEIDNTINEKDMLTYTRQGKLFKHNDIEFKEWLPEVYRILKNNTHCYIMINPRNLKELQQTAEDVGFIFQNLIIWDKGNATPNRYYMNAIELILMLRKGKAKNINNMGTKNILRVPNVTGNKLHPTEKPVDLMRIMVENSTKAGETVCDPFMGVGGVAIACKAAGRNFIGMEIDEKYYTIAENRINEYEADEIETIEEIVEKYEYTQLTFF